QAAAHSVLDHAPVHRPAAAVDHGVARQLAGGGDQLGLVDQAQAAGHRRLAGGLAGEHHVLLGADRQLPCAAHSTPAPACRSRRMPRATSSAGLTPVRFRPSSTRVIATAGCMPTTTVRASITAASAEMVAIMRPMKESTMSSAEISISTPRAE